MQSGIAAMTTRPIAKKDSKKTKFPTLICAGGTKIRAMAKIQVIMPMIDTVQIPLWGWGIRYALGTFGFVYRSLMAAANIIIYMTR